MPYPIDHFCEDLLTVLQTSHPRLFWEITGDDNSQTGKVIAKMHYYDQSRIAFSYSFSYEVILSFPGRSDAVVVVSDRIAREIGNEIGHFFLSK